MPAAVPSPMYTVLEHPKVGHPLLLLVFFAQVVGVLYLFDLFFFFTVQHDKENFFHEIYPKPNPTRLKPRFYVCIMQSYFENDFFDIYKKATVTPA